jgi:hypothetical protein
LRIRGLNYYPEAELRQTFEPRSDGGIAINKLRVQPWVGTAITAGWRKYTDIRVPVLAICAVPHDLEPYATGNPKLPAYEASDLAITDSQANAFERGVSSARVVRIPHANHLIFGSRPRKERQPADIAVFHSRFWPNVFLADKMRLRGVTSRLPLQ